MGKMNTLNAEYIGKVGKTYGVRQYRKSIEKIIPFSHAPHNKTQTNSVRAFEKLNRISSYVARVFWQNLNLSDKTMNKHNAVAKWLKPVVKTHSFNLNNIIEVVPSNPTLRLKNVALSLETKTATVEIENSLYSQYTTSEKIFVALVTDKGTVKNGGVYNGITQTLSFTWDYSDFLSLSVVVFKSSVQFKKKIVNGFCIFSQNQEYVKDGILFTSFLPLNVAPHFLDGVLKLDTSDFVYSSGTLDYIEN